MIFFLERLYQAGVSLSELIVHFSFLFTVDNSTLVQSCKQAPIIITIFSLLIEKRNLIYENIQFNVKESSDQNNNFPKSVSEFVNTDDFFNSWWSKFRIQDKEFINHISSSSFFKEYFKILCKSTSIEQSNTITVQNILSTNLIIYRLLENKEALYSFFKSLIRYKKNEIAMYHMMQVLINLTLLDCKRICQFLLSESIDNNKKSNFNEELIKMSNSGNIFFGIKRIINIISKSASKKNHQLILEWCTILFNRICALNCNDSDVFENLISNEYISFNCWITNVCKLVSTILHEKKFLTGPIGGSIISLVDKHAPTLIQLVLSNKDLQLSCSILKMISKSISNDNDIMNKDSNENNNVTDLSSSGDIPNSNSSSNPTSLAVSKKKSLPDVGDLSDEETDDDLMESHTFSPFNDGSNSFKNSTEEDVFDEFSPDVSDSTSSLNGEEITSIRLKFLNLLFDNNSIITEVLYSKDNNGNLPPQLGIYRFSLLRLLCNITLLQIPTFEQKILDSGWFNIIFDLFFHYEFHSIYQEWVKNFLRALSSNQVLLEKALEQVSFIDKVAAVEQKNKKQRPLNFCYMVLMVQMLFQNPCGEKCISTNPNAKSLQKMKKLQL